MYKYNGSQNFVERETFSAENMFNSRQMVHSVNIALDGCTTVMRYLSKSVVNIYTKYLMASNIY